MFKKRALVRRRKRHGFGIIRLFMSLIMISLLSLGVYGAYKSFSGIDPLKISPFAVAKDLVKSDTAMHFLGGLLSFSPKKVVTSQSIPASEEKTSSEVRSNPKPPVPPKPQPKLSFRFAIVTDSHNDSTHLKNALTQAKQGNAEFVLGLGDFTDVGTVDDLRTAKSQFDSVNLPYYVIPGDHDLWDSRNRSLEPTSDFKAVFGKSYSSFATHGVGFLLINNSDNYTGVDPDQYTFINDQLDSFKQSNLKLVFAFASTPLYHPSSDHFMGKVEPKLKEQASGLTYLLKTKGVEEVFAGDTHFFSQYTEPKNNLKMTAVGAITEDRNAQTPRYCLVDVFEDGSYNITDTEVK